MRIIQRIQFSTITMLSGVMLSSISVLQAAEFDYLDRQANVISTTHQVGYQIRINEAFEPIGELHHRQTSNNLEFKVSFAAYRNGGDIILIHAETLESETGVLDYAYLPQTTLNDVPFGTREQCIPAEAEAELKTNREALFVRNNGFNLALPFLLTQFIVASPNGNGETAISYGRAVETCSEISETFRAETRQRVNTFIEVQEID